MGWASKMNEGIQALPDLKEKMHTQYEKRRRFTHNMQHYENKEYDHTIIYRFLQMQL